MWAAEWDHRMAEMWAEHSVLSWVDLKVVQMVVSLEIYLAEKWVASTVERTASLQAV